MVKGGEFVGGAVLGAGLGVVGDLVRETIEKSIDFKPSLENLQYTQKSLQPCVVEIGALNTRLGYPDEIKDLKATMLEGDALDNKFKDASVWNLGNPFYTDELVELEESRHKQLEILKVQGIRDAKENLVLARESNTDVKQIVTWTGKTSDELIQVASCGKEAETLGKESLVLARDHTKQLDDCKTRVDEIGDWTGKTTHQLHQVAIDGKEAVSLGRDTYKQINELRTALDQGFQLSRVIKGDKALEAVVEQAALGKSVEALDGAIQQEQWGSSIIREGWTRVKIRLAFPVTVYVENDAAVDSAVWGIQPDELKAYRVEIDKGVELARKCSQVTEWTTAKTEKYTNKILALEKTLEALAARLEQNTTLLSPKEGLKSTQSHYTTTTLGLGAPAKPIIT